MGIMAAITGGIGGLCALLGIITITEVLEPLGAQYTWEFWFALAALLFLAAIALNSGRRGGVD